MIETNDLYVKVNGIWTEVSEIILRAFTTNGSVKDFCYTPDNIKIEQKACDTCENLEEGDTLYCSSDWDGGIGFDYIRDIKYCPVCGRRL